MLPARLRIPVLTERGCPRRRAWLDQRAGKFYAARFGEIAVFLLRGLPANIPCKADGETSHSWVKTAPMKTQRISIIVVLIAVAIGMVLMLSVREPRYHGRTLTRWLWQCNDTPLNETQRLQEAQSAIRAIGAKRALPKLLSLVEATDDPVSLWLIDKTDKYRIRFLEWRSSERYSFGDWQSCQWQSAEDFQQLGITGFEALETNASPAVERLTKLLDNAPHAFTAARCLEFIGKPAESALCRGLTNQDWQVRQLSLGALASVTDEDTVYVARIKNCLKDPSEAVRFTAVEDVGAQTAMPETVVPLLMQVMQEDTSEHVRVCATATLADFGTNAQMAFPVLSNLVVNGRQSTANAAVKSLFAIAPNEAMPILLNAASSSQPSAASALRMVTKMAPEQATPILFKRLHSPESRVRVGAVSLLCSMAVKTPAIQAAIEQATTDATPEVAYTAKNYLRDSYKREHPDGPFFPNEPSFGGQSLGQWLKMKSPDGAFTFEAQNAFRSMGTNAIPALIERMEFRLPPGTVVLYDVSLDAVKALIVMGEQAKPALPRLQTLMDSPDPDLALFAMLASCGTGSNAAPLLIKGLTNPFADVRGEAAHCLTDDPDGHFVGQRKQAISLFVKLLNDPDEDVRLSATNQLKAIDPAVAAKAGIK
jgi:HEAT repeat protein